MALAGALAAAATGWTRSLTATDRPPPAIRIVDVRPLQTSDAALRELFSHELAVRVAVTDWNLYPDPPAAAAGVSRRDGGHWHLYVDGESLGDIHTAVAYTPYLVAGTHWIAAELRHVDHTALRPPVWSEPVIVYVPKRIRCRQTGPSGPLSSTSPELSCRS